MPSAAPPSPIHKFNSLLALFLNALCDASASERVAEARTYFAALIALDPEDRTALNAFAGATHGLSNLISRKSTRVFHDTSFATKDDIMTVYNDLSDADRITSWKYMKKLYALAIKVRPEIADAAASVTSAVANGCDGGNMVYKALRSAAEAMLSALPQKQDVLETIAVVHLASDEDLLASYLETHDSEASQLLLTDPDESIAVLGVPFLPGGASRARELTALCDSLDVLKSAALQVATLVLTLTTLPPETVASMAGIASKLADTMNGQDIDMLALSRDPMALLEKLHASGAGAEIMNLINEM